MLAPVKDFENKKNKKLSWTAFIVNVTFHFYLAVQTAQLTSSLDQNDQQVSIHPVVTTSPACSTLGGIQHTIQKATHAG